MLEFSTSEGGSRPDWFSRSRLIGTTRTLLSQHEPTDPFWRPLAQGPASASEVSEHERAALELITPRAVPEQHSSPEWFERQLTCRHELLRRLVRKNHRLEDRYEAGKRYVAHEVEYFAGWERLQQGSEQFQLAEARPWWRVGDPLLNADLVSNYQGDAQALRREGFERIERDVYLERVRQSVMRHVLADPFHQCPELVWAARAFVLYALPIRMWRQHGVGPLVRRNVTTLVAQCQETLLRQHALLPMKPLYSLPRESNNISTFFISKSRDFCVDEGHRLIRGPLDKARVRIIEDDGGQQALFFDRDLVVKRSGGADSYISVELDGSHSDVLGALMRAIESFEIDPNVFEHLPRVCAGMFAAAHRDRRLQFNYPGTFWDTSSGYRLCRIIGFNPDNHRHRKRIQDVRQVLETFILHREIRGRDERGNRIDMKWSGPIIEARKAKLELNLEAREGLSEQHTFQSWTIAKELWDMTLLEDDGGAPAFMILDEKAFHLDERSSLPFNLYWTLINRAYMGNYTSVNEDRVGDDGSFSPRLGVLYDWAGMERSYIKIRRMKRRFRRAFDLMVQGGLLLSWECPELDPEHDISFEALRHARIRTRFSSDQLENFSAGRRLASES